MKGRWVGGVVSVCFLLVVSVTLGGCGAKDTEEPLEGLPGRGMNEADLGGGSGADGSGGTRGSLAAAQGGRAAQGPLEDIFFAYDSFDLDDGARSILRAHAEWLDANSSVTVEIEGHCDERGTIEYNLALGSRRAAAAKEYLIALGVSPARVSTISYGEELPVCRDTSESCLERNRRDHFVVLGE